MMKKRKNNERKIEHLSLVGKTKSEIIDLLGDDFNFYPDDIWYYIISKTWYGRKKILYIEFEDDIVIRKSIVSMYGKIKK
ncbi:hypothetical protein ACFO4P_07605 [Epilithonimonas pallida]|uniref:SmpA / OmlA family protein n=1 Tax=Epilithonimonas pallida TaxID=373671 RepID=A0ABY1R3E1_9FLAO|nr:hypothetical protein [Epilithonimonas pallida]SMP94189.1 hypothetical protein SAMN05421679_105271 [Epilithonimonas pallida]